MSSEAAHEHTTHYDPLGIKIGMWTFLFTEGLLFGTLFIAYFVYLNMYPWEFMAASATLDKLIGAGNTVVLLTSSLTMALSIAALERSNRRLSIQLMVATLGFALVFLVVKGFEWAHKFEVGIYPRSEYMLTQLREEQLFYGFYFTMTGLHAAHVIIGGVLILVAIKMVASGSVHKGRIALLENVGLYWHLVDVIWIFLFPLFYLIGRN